MSDLRNEQTATVNEADSRKLSFSKRDASEMEDSHDCDDVLKQVQKQQDQVHSHRALEFYNGQHENLKSLRFDKPADNDNLPVWPHNEELTEEVNQAWQLAQSLLQNEALLERNVESLETDSATEQETITQLDHATRSVYENGDEATKKAVLRLARRAEHAEQLSQVKDKFSELTDKSYATLFQVNALSMLIADLSNLSQEGIHPGTKAMKTANKKMRAFEEAAKKILDPEELKSLPADASDGDITAKVLNNRKPFEEESLFSKKSVGKISLPKEIKQIALAYNEVMEQCDDFLRSPNSTTKEKVQGIKLESKEYGKRIQAALNFLDEALENERKREKSSRRKPRTVGFFAKKRKKVNLPGSRSQEREGSQQVFCWILDKVAGALALENQAREVSACESTSATRHSPYKLNRSREAPLGNFDQGRPIRFGDYAVTKLGGFLILYPPDALPFIIELKPLFREGEGWMDILKGGEQQIVSHMAKYIAMCFNFCGAGFDSHATGAVGSLAFLKVTRLELTGMGTDSARLQLRESDYHPLLTKTNFRKWAKSNEGTNFDDLENILYENETEDCEIPSGFKLLYQIMRAKSGELFGQLWIDEKSDSASLGNVVGLGSFSCVFAKKEEDCEEVTKVSRLGRFHGLRNEVAVLKLLGDRAKNDCNSPRRRLPMLVKYGMLDVPVGSIQQELPYVRITPKAQPLALHGYYNLETHEAGKLASLSVDMLDALTFLHAKKVLISHNDLSLENILITKEKRAVLVDFSVATTLLDERILGFIGNPLTAHKDAHAFTPWCADDFHDFASLGFVLAILCARKDRVWQGHAGSFSESGLAKHRRDQAKKMISDFCSEPRQPDDDFVSDSCSKSRQPDDDLVLNRLAEYHKGGEKSLLGVLKAVLIGLVQRDEESVLERGCRKCTTGCTNGHCRCKKQNQECCGLCRCTGCQNRDTRTSLEDCRKEVDFCRPKSGSL